MNVRSPFFGRSSRGTLAVAVAIGLGLATLVLPACGYRPIAGYERSGAEGPRLHVVFGPRTVPAARAHDALVGAVSSRLAEARELAGGTGYPRLEVELVRIDETAEGLASAGDVPLSRGLRITVVGRARVLRGPNEAAAFDTGDVSAHVTLSSSGPAPQALVLREEATMGAARLLGRRLAERALGLPSPSDEGRGSDF